MPKTITIIFKRKAEAFIAKMSNASTVCYYLNEDYSHFFDLLSRFGKDKIKSLAGLFAESLSEMTEPLLELSSKISKEHDSLEWWGGQIASRSTSATPLFLNIVYLSCAKKILSIAEKDIVFITDSPALASCIAETSKKMGNNVIVQKEWISGRVRKIRQQVFNAGHIIFFLFQAFQNGLYVSRINKPNRNIKTQNKKRIVIRSWLTKGTVNSSGEYRDRNFGVLPEWLRSKGYEVLTLPMFFNMDKAEHVFYSTIKNNEHFLIPEHYLRWTDYFKVVYDVYKLSCHRVQNAILQEIDTSPLFNENIRGRGFSKDSFKLNLCYPLLKRLKEERIEIDSFFYAFESNAPEKQFILACRKFFPNSRILGFQHVPVFSNNLKYHLSPDDEKYHPLPDKIVCSGPIFVKLLKEAGFSPEILLSGPNLRFGAVHIERTTEAENAGRKKMLLLPLTDKYDLAFDLFLKVKEALKNSRDYDVYIRSHPLLSKETLIRFLKKTEMGRVEFADDGTMQDWLKRSYAVISSCNSVTILETIIAGVPLIRVIPDNTFFYDPFAWSEYPLKPVNTSEEIEKQLYQIRELKTEIDIFNGISKRILSEYFTKPNEENMKVFL